MTSQQYMPLSSACSSIYFTIDNLHQVHYLYQYSLQFFLDIFTSLLINNPGKIDNSSKIFIQQTIKAFHYKKQLVCITMCVSIKIKIPRAVLQLPARQQCQSSPFTSKMAKWSELVVLFSWQLQNGSQDFDFFNCHGSQTFTLAEINCCISALKS